MTEPATEIAPLRPPFTITRQMQLSHEEAENIWKQISVANRKVTTEGQRANAEAFIRKVFAFRKSVDPQFFTDLSEGSEFVRVDEANRDGKFGIFYDLKDGSFYQGSTLDSTHRGTPNRESLKPLQGVDHWNDYGLKALEGLWSAISYKAAPPRRNA